MRAVFARDFLSLRCYGGDFGLSKRIPRDLSGETPTFASLKNETDFELETPWGVGSWPKIKGYVLRMSLPIFSSVVFFANGIVSLKFLLRNLLKFSVSSLALFLFRGLKLVVLL